VSREEPQRASDVFSTLVRTYRRRARLTQEALALRTGLSTRTIRNLEAGSLHRPRHATIRLLSEGLGLNDAESAAFTAAERGTNHAAEAPSPRARTDTLPADLADFTGRSKLVADVCTALVETPTSAGSTPCRLVGLSGPPGVGKSALAVRIGHLMRSWFGDGTLYVDMHGLAGRPLDAGDALNQVLRALLGHATSLPDDLDERAALLRATVAHRRTLIILDDVRSEAHVRPLLPAGSGCAVLLASRRPLTGLDNLVGFDLHVFGPEEAVDLLTAIVGADRVDAERAAAERITELCGKLPLAIRLAGVRLTGRQHWTLTRMADRLTDQHGRLDALEVGDRAVRASIQLSYDSLEADAKRLFRLLGALCETDVPDWVAAPLLDLADVDADEVLESLVDARLVDVRGLRRPRYLMHSLVRLYAGERSAAEDSPADRAAAIQRLLGAWLYLLERAEPRLPGGLARIGTGGGHRTVVNPAVVAAVQDDPMDWFDTERLAVVAAVNVGCDAALDELVWDVAGCLGRYLELSGDLDLWESVLRRSLVAVRAAGNLRGEAHLLRGMGEIMLDSDRYGPAREALAAALDRFLEVGEPVGAAHVQRALGVLDRMSGDAQSAMRRFTAALQVFRRNDDPVGHAETLFSLGALCRDRGRNFQALAYYERALALENTLGNRLNQVLLLSSIGSALLAEDRVSEARATLTKAVELAREVQQGEAYALVFLGEAETRSGDFAAASTRLASALDIVRRVQDRYGEALAIRALGDLHRASGALEQSHSALQKALALWEELESPVQRARTLVRLGVLQGDLGDPAGAIRTWRSAADIFDRQGSTEGDRVRVLVRRLSGTLSATS
jgi:tetratricopeptide (TPR) repeat protein/transcriptional regulator with XRE-family HTH domain